ncbi:Octaprenyl diphosphate synthase [Microbacterium lemovicicum]|uniref:Octaprenyl diphosphate synthase n=1 Tax=Microbacterium lemovicicum TaxID=1072463 RepID=A0A3S9WAX9_9MICO|nr:polyprenyl synthetase family protein [Microbacterium lemovicicum]AZS37185.1 Octaprenyl diphosphate synthase [Microbacterium lemovicicum]
MITLATDAASRAAIDREIDRALGRIAARCLALGDGAVALGDAIARSTTGGKRFRPALVVSAFSAFGSDPADVPALYPVAAAFELLHTAFVVHDDVIDNDTERRGIPNVVGEFRDRGRSSGADAAASSLVGDAAGILAGDLLLHEAERIIALAALDPGARALILDVIDDAVFVSVAGELADVENAAAGDWASPEAILNAAHDKTAVYSFTAPLRAGAILAGAPPEAFPAIDRFGGRLGLAFQLVDDLIGAFGSPEQAGRDAGGDLREAKRTPLVALARESASWPLVSSALALAHTGPIAVAEAQRMLDESGARDGVLGLIEETLAESRAAARDASLPIDVRTLLLGLADAVQERIP